MGRDGGKGSDRQSMNCGLLTRIQMLARIDLESVVDSEGWRGGGEQNRKFLNLTIYLIICFILIHLVKALSVFSLILSIV